MMWNYFKLITQRPGCLLILAGFLCACGEGSNAYKDYSNHDLSEQLSKCDRADSKSPRYAITCENMHKECQRRNKEKGFTVCR